LRYYQLYITWRWTIRKAFVILYFVTRLSIRIDFQPSGSSLGPGMIRLLELVSKNGSLRAAATEMKISYRKAWLLLQAIQRTFDGPVVVATTGGSSGGGTKLTELGEQLVILYRKVEVSAALGSEAELKMLTLLVQPNAPCRRRRTSGTK
jgi:molybdate transport system regulatory protein